MLVDLEDEILLNEDIIDEIGAVENAGGDVSELDKRVADSYTQINEILEDLYDYAESEMEMPRNDTNSGIVGLTDTASRILYFYRLPHIKKNGQSESIAHLKYLL